MCVCVCVQHLCVIFPEVMCVYINPDYYIKPHNYDIKVKIVSLIHNYRIIKLKL